MNDDTPVSTWQDGTVSESGQQIIEGSAPAGVRVISNVEMLKALADPLRLRLLSALMRGPAGEQPVMSVKELAAELGEPQTKLYRHVRQLEAAGLIRVAASRLVSGIVEQRYQACQGDLMLGPGLTDAEWSSQGMEDAIAAALELYRGKFFAAQRAGRLGSAAAAPAEPHRRVMLAVSEAWVPASKAAAIRERLQEIMEEIESYPGSPGEGGDAVQVDVLIGYFSPAPPG